MHYRTVLHRFAGIIAVCLMSLTGCAASESSSTVQSESSTAAHDIDLFAMDTYMNLRAYGDKADEALKAASEKIQSLEHTLSVTEENSDIWKINNSGGEGAEVSEDTITLIKAAKEYGAATDGALDITVYPVLKEWGFTTGEYRIPSEARIEELLKKVDYTQIDVSGTSVGIPDEVQIDLGALAKGYTGDKVMEELRSRGVESAIISLGGNVQALGTKPDGSPWSVAVVDPYTPGTDMCIVKVSGKAVITSGNYERYFTGEDGKDYWHIIDPADGYPADNGIVSATIISDSGLMCDALSTALFALGTEKAEEYWRAHGGFEMILVTDDKRILYTEGISDTFSNISAMPAEVITGD